MIVAAAWWPSAEASPAKQNQSSPVLVNRHLLFGDFVPVNSKKKDAGMRHRPLPKRRPSERKLITGPPWADRARSLYRTAAPFAVDCQKQDTVAVWIIASSSVGWLC